MRPGPHAAASLRVGPAGLALSEQLVLAGLRAWGRARMEGEEPRALIGPSLTHVASRPVATVFVSMMEAIEREATRRMQIHCIACAGYSQDEQRVVLACGLARTAPELAGGLLGPLVRACGAPVLLARGLNIALANAGYPMPERLWDEAPATVH